MEKSKRKNFGGKWLLLTGGLLGSLPGWGQTEQAAAASGGTDNSAFWVLAVLGLFLLIAIIVIGDAIKNLANNRDLWRSKGTGKKIGTGLLLFTLLSTDAFAAGEGGKTYLITEDSFWLLVGLDTVLLLIVAYLLSTLRRLIKDLQGEEETTAVAEEEEKETWTKKVMKSLTDTTPIDKEEEIVLAHEHDGIQELDNNLPPWWKWLFYVSIIFSVVYLLHYHVLGTGDTQIEEYEKEMARAEAQVAAYMAEQKMNVDENSVTIVEEEDRLQKGKAIYTEHCVQCHGEKGGGGVGPNLTDRYWIHGGSIKDVFSTIKYGVPQKGMISWKAQLNPMQMQNVASYILTTIQKNDPPEGKEPQGELYEPEQEEAAPDTTGTGSDTSAVASATGENG